MRAKMSDRDRQVYDHICKGSAALIAVQEARTILAETEPGTEGWGDIPYRTFDDERDALAEALTAFVDS